MPNGILHGVDNQSSYAVTSREGKGLVAFSTRSLRPYRYINVIFIPSSEILISVRSHIRLKTGNEIYTNTSNYQRIKKPYLIV